MATLRTAIHLLLTYLLIFVLKVQNRKRINLRIWNVAHHYNIGVICCTRPRLCKSRQLQAYNIHLQVIARRARRYAPAGRRTDCVDVSAVCTALVACRAAVLPVAYGAAGLGVAHLARSWGRQTDGRIAAGIQEISD